MGDPSINGLIIGVVLIPCFIAILNIYFSLSKTRGKIILTLLLNCPVILWGLSMFDILRDVAKAMLSFEFENYSNLIFYFIYFGPVAFGAYSLLSYLAKKYLK